MKLAFQIALRFLRNSMGQTILIVLGISVGVSVQVFIGSLIGGLQDSLVETTIGNSSQITIVSEDYITDYDDLYDDIIDTEGVTEMSFAIDKPGNIILSDESSPILVRGLDLEKSEGIYQLDSKLIDGKMPTSNNEVLIGKELLEELELAIDDTITISVPLVGDTDVVIVGVYDFNVSQINNSWIITNLITAQNIINEEDVITSIEIQVEDVFMADVIASNIQEETNYEVTNWIDLNQELLSGLQAQGSSSLMIQVFVTISVVLGISSVLAITVIQKSRQIGILKAMGIKDKTASLIFLSQGFILGVLGAIFGVLLGLFLTWSFSSFALDPDGNPVVPLLLDRNFIMISALVAIVSASIASIIPARKSQKLSVIEVIKNG